MDGLTRNAIKSQRKLWPNCKVPYVISSSYSSYERSVIASAMSEYHEKTCIKYVYQYFFCDSSIFSQNQQVNSRYTLIIQQAKLTAIFTQNLRLQCKSRHVQTLHMPRPTLQSQILPQSNLRNYTLCIYVLTFFGRESNIYYTTSSMHTCINRGTGGSFPPSLRSPTPEPSGGRSKLGEKTLRI